MAVSGKVVELLPRALYRVVVEGGRAGVVHRRIKGHQVEEELGRFDAAVEKTAAELREVAEKVRSRAGAAETSILEAYVLMVTDSTLREEIERRVRLDRQCVEWALDNAMYEMTAQLRDAEDAYLVERSHDFEFIRDRIMRALTGRGREPPRQPRAATGPQVPVAGRTQRRSTPCESGTRVNRRMGPGPVNATAGNRPAGARGNPTVGSGGGANER